MTVTILGDFADPLSFLASQRVAQIASLDLIDLRWLAVEADRTCPVRGRPLDVELAEHARRLAMPGERIPSAEVTVPNSRAATAAYAESLTDGVADAMRRALFDAVWVHGSDVGDPNVIRGIVFTVLGAGTRVGDIDWRIRANLPLVNLGGPDVLATSRRLGLIVSMGRGPLTIRGQERVDEWRSRWQRRGSPELPLLLTAGGEAFAGERALAWLADQLPHHSPVSSRPCPTAATS